MRHLLFAALLPLAACGNVFDDDGRGIEPDGTGAVRRYAAAGFTEVSAAGPDDVVVAVGPAFAVRAEGDPAVLDRLSIEVEDGELTVRRRNGPSLRGRARVFVSLPAIREASIAGSGSLSVDRAEGEAFEASIAGSGRLSVAALRTRSLEASIAGSGDFVAAGTARAIKVSIAGSGSVVAPNLVGEEAKVSIAGSGDVAMRVNGTAKVDILGSGNVDLGGGARCTVNRMGSGQARCG